MRPVTSHNLRMPKHAKLTNPDAANQQMIGVAIQSIKVYLPPLGSSAFVGIAARQINGIC
jgi:hypothetical protein